MIASRIIDLSLLLELYREYVHDTCVTQDRDSNSLSDFIGWLSRIDAEMKWREEVERNANS